MKYLVITIILISAAAQLNGQSLIYMKRKIAGIKESGRVYFKGRLIGEFRDNSKVHYRRREETEQFILMTAMQARPAAAPPQNRQQPFISSSLDSSWSDG